MRQFVTYGCLALALLFTGKAHSAESDCFDAAKTIKELDACADSRITPTLAKVNSLLAEIKSKYRNNENVREIIGDADQQWSAYTNTQCMLEGVIAMGLNGELDRHTLSVGKAFSKCVFRTAKEMEAALLAATGGR